MKTGIIYDIKMLLHEADEPHYECPERMTKILEQIQQFSQNILVEQIVQQVDFEYIQMTHCNHYLNGLKSIDTSIETQWFLPDDSYFCKQSLTAANIAVSAVINAIDNIVSNKWQNGFAIVRPPGHHAHGATEKFNISGFCLLNNVAIGANYLLKKFQFQRIVILDWDVHHGDGTQQIFYESNSVLYISLHRFDNGNFFPGLSGEVSNIGSSKGKGYNINIPWNTQENQENNIGDAEYMYAFDKVIFPILNEYQPEFILVSAGFDSSKGDPLGGNIDVENAYNYYIQKLKLIQSNLLLVLEGGYDLNTIGSNFKKCIDSLMLKNYQDENILKLKPNQISISCINQVILHHKKYWKCLGDQCVFEETLIDNNQLIQLNEFQETTINKVNGQFNQQIKINLQNEFPINEINNMHL